MTRITGIITSAALSLSAITSAASAQPAPSGAGAAAYEGSFDGATGQLKIGPVRNGIAKIEIDAGGAGCSASVSGEAAVSDNKLIMTKADDGSTCRLVMEQTAQGIKITESDCGIWHGASCDFVTGDQALHRVR